MDDLYEILYHYSSRMTDDLKLQLQLHCYRLMLSFLHNLSIQRTGKQRPTYRSMTNLKNNDPDRSSNSSSAQSRHPRALDPESLTFTALVTVAAARRASILVGGKAEYPRSPLPSDTPSPRCDMMHPAALVDIINTALTMAEEIEFDWEDNDD